MSKLLRDLEKQCWGHRIDDVLVDGQLHFDKTKFAHLIIDECLKAIDRTNTHHVHTTFDDGLVKHTINQSKQAVRDHFSDTTTITP